MIADTESNEKVSRIVTEFFSSLIWLEGSSCWRSFSIKNAELVKAVTLAFRSIK